MMSRKSVANCLLFFSILLAGCFIAAAQEAEPGIEDQQVEYPRITCEELKKLIDTKATADIVIVDNSPKEAYDEEGHIPGAVNLPWASQIKPPINLPRNKTLVMYCPCTHEEDSTDMANKLRQFGYYKVKLLDGGWFKWQELKYPIEKAAGK